MSSITSSRSAVRTPKWSAPRRKLLPTQLVVYLFAGFYPFAAMANVPDAGPLVVHLLCSGTHAYEEAESVESTAPKPGASETKTVLMERSDPVSFQVDLNYEEGYATLRAEEMKWTGAIKLARWSEDERLIRSSAFTADADAVRADFKKANRALMGVLTFGMTEVAGSPTNELYISRKTGVFNFRGASGSCRKIDIDENLF